MTIASPDEPAAERAIADHRAPDRRSPRSARSTPARCGASRPSAPSSRSCRAPTACVHISELAPYRVREVDRRRQGRRRGRGQGHRHRREGKIRLSRKAVIMESPDYDPSQYEGMEMAMAGGGGERERGDGGGEPRRPRAATAAAAAAPAAAAAVVAVAARRRSRRRRRRQPLTAFLSLRRSERAAFGPPFSFSLG